MRDQAAEWRERAKQQLGGQGQGGAMQREAAQSDRDGQRDGRGRSRSDDLPSEVTFY